MKWATRPSGLVADPALDSAQVEYSVDEKLAVLAEAAQPGMSISYVARRRELHRDSAAIGL